MGILPLSRMDGWLIGLLSLGLTAGLLVGIYIIWGLVTALLMIRGRLKPHIIIGRLEAVDKVVDNPSKHIYKNVRLISDNNDQPILFQNLILGPELRKANVLRLGGRFILALRKKGAGSAKTAWLLGVSNGQDTHAFKADLKKACRLEWAQVFFLALLGSMSGFLFLMPALVDRGFDFVPILASLACGLIPAAVLAGLYKQAADRFALQVRAGLENVARTWQPRAKAPEAQTRAMPLLVADSEIEGAGFLAGLVSLGGVFIFFKWFAKSLIVLSSAFARPSFEWRALKIISHGRACRNADNSIFVSDVVLQDPFSGVQKKIKRLYPAPDLIKNGLIDAGMEGLWMIQTGTLGHPATEESRGGLKIAAYINKPKDTIHIDLFDILRLYNYTPLLAPALAALIGALATLFLIIGRSSGSPAPLDYLWLIPAAVLPALIMRRAGKRITAAVARCIQTGPALNNGPNSQGPENQRLI